MLFDINTAIGHWPFRQVPHQSVPELRSQLTDYCVWSAGRKLSQLRG